MKEVTPWRVYFRDSDCIHPDLRLIGWSRFRRAEPLALPPHHHGDAYEIHYIRRGRFDVIVDHSVHNVRAGHVVVTGPNEVHGGVKSALQKCEFHWIQYHAAGLCEDTRRLLDECCRQRVIRVRASTGERLENILSVHHDVRPTSALGCRAMMSLFVCDMHDAISDDHVISEPIRKALVMMRSNLGEAPRLDQLAFDLGVSTSHLSMTFRDEVGETPGQWLMHERLDAACRMLEQGRTTRDIAWDLGYSTPQNFATSFRREFGMTPTDFRDYVQGVSRGELPAPFVD